MRSTAGSKEQNMNDKKDRYVTLFQAGMLILNILAVGLICGFIYATTNRILAHYDARTFLDSVVTIPVNPGENLLLCMGLMMVMVITFACGRSGSRITAV